MICSIYKVTCKTNGKNYIGFALNYRKRLKAHKRCYVKYNYKFYKAIIKYGWNNFDWCVIYQSKDKEYTLNVMEQYFIQLYDSIKNGYNTTLGGGGTLGLKHTTETKNKISSTHKGKVISIEQKEKQKISLNKLFKSNEYIHPNTGIKRSKETIQKRNDTRRKNGLFLPETNPMYNKKHTEKSRLIQSEKAKNREKIQCIHCSKIIDVSNHKRWHGDKCKSLDKEIHHSKEST